MFVHLKEGFIIPARKHKQPVIAFTKDLITCLLDIPLLNAGKIFNLSVCTLRKIAKWRGFSFWPFRHLLNGETLHNGLSSKDVQELRIKVMEDLEHHDPILISLLKQVDDESRSIRDAHKADNFVPMLANEDSWEQEDETADSACINQCQKAYDTYSQMDVSVPSAWKRQERVVTISVASDEEQDMELVWRKLARKVAVPYYSRTRKCTALYASNAALSFAHSTKTCMFSDGRDASAETRPIELSDSKADVDCRECILSDLGAYVDFPQPQVKAVNTKKSSDDSKVYWREAWSRLCDMSDEISCDDACEGPERYDLDSLSDDSETVLFDSSILREPSLITDLI